MSALYDYMRCIGPNPYADRERVGPSDSFELAATPENLRQAIQEKGISVFQFRFVEQHPAYPPTTCSPVEYGIKIGDVDSIQTLISLGSDLANGSPPYNLSQELHFYINCLQEDVRPNLEIFNLLLSRSSDVNGKEYGLTPLEHAVKTMSRYKKIHWDVIEGLLQKMAQISPNAPRLPFKILKDCHHHKINPWGQMKRSVEEEELFLDHLARYVVLEKRYFPQSNSYLRCDEFEFHTSNIQEIFSKMALSFDDSSSPIDKINDLSKKLKISDLANSVKFFEEWVECESNKTRWRNNQNDLIRTKNEEFTRISSYFTTYHNLFQMLVKEGTFKGCFLPSLLLSFESHINKYKSQVLQAEFLIGMFKEWGLIEKKDQMEQDETDITDA